MSVWNICVQYTFADMDDANYKIIGLGNGVTFYLILTYTWLISEVLESCFFQNETS